ncbi:MAG: sugar ABC transporter permease [Candidatus Izemoplasmatales bacterium]|nr:sugar ABC transporter permease [Candidatus Izemoplasmatales bacterium]MDD4354977.1 sugar ABC transporter permease [Candidatus Izemoplasmatales bacterium]MDD4988005.1 sugar ABC transporter permease [Candidatus Izemoplasmatales bacterium]MDY0372578.1 sugar ABC transporter permease [Candidatus Izemoplasmatales bacterium]
MKTSSVTKLKKQENYIGYLFASPWLIGLIVLGIFPIFMSLYFSFTNYNMISAPTWVGFTNYRILFTNDDLFWKSLGNTVYHVMIAVPLGIIVGIALALLLNSKVKGMSIYRTMFYLPNVVSVVAMTLLWLWLFQPNFGLINQLLSPFYKLFNLEPLGWYLDQNMSKMTLILMGLWTAGGSMVIYLAQMQDIPVTLYESAEIDGAGWFKKTIHITLPLMTPSIFFNFIMGLIGSFQVFTIAYIMTNGGPSRSTYYYAYYLFDKMMNDNAMGMASAMAWILLVMVLIVTIVALRLNKFVFYLGEET